VIPNNVLSTTPIPGAFLPPRTNVRFSASAGAMDTHFGGIALGDPSQGVQYQLWTCFTDGNNIYLEAPNTPAFIELANVGAAWVAVAFDQNARVFIAYSTAAGNAFYYWFDTTISAYRTSTITGFVPRVFADLDDARPALLASSDVLLAYQRAGTLFLRAQRDRFGVEYNLGAVPATLVQIGMNTVDRFQFAFQNVQGKANALPPAEYSPYLGINEQA
jgi:hypothetical protein